MFISVCGGASRYSVAKARNPALAKSWLTPSGPALPDLKPPM